MHQAVDVHQMIIKAQLLYITNLQPDIHRPMLRVDVHHPLHLKYIKSTTFVC